MILIQDADLEYDPQDYLPMLRALRPDVETAYGSRYLGQRQKQGFTLLPGKHPQQGVGSWAAGQILTWVDSLLLYGRWITDMLTAYKLYPANAVRAMRLRTSGFEGDHEITARLIRGGHKITEVPIESRAQKCGRGKKDQSARRLNRSLDTFKVSFHPSCLRKWGLTPLPLIHTSLSETHRTKKLPVSVFYSLRYNNDNKR